MRNGWHWLQESRIAYGTVDEALSLFPWLKFCSRELSHDWDKSNDKNKVLPNKPLSGLVPGYPGTALSLHVNFVYNANAAANNKNNNNNSNKNHTLNSDWFGQLIGGAKHEK